jgi:hypothetical protein
VHNVPLTDLIPNSDWCLIRYYNPEIRQGNLLTKPRVRYIHKTNRDNACEILTIGGRHRSQRTKLGMCALISSYFSQNASASDHAGNFGKELPARTKSRQAARWRVLRISRSLSQSHPLAFNPPAPPGRLDLHPSAPHRRGQGSAPRQHRHGRHRHGTGDQPGPVCADFLMARWKRAAPEAQGDKPRLLRGPAGVRPLDKQDHIRPRTGTRPMRGIISVDGMAITTLTGAA